MSQWGDIAQFTALALLVFHLTGSGLGVSGVVIAEIVPVLLLAPVAGPLVDRLPALGRRSATVFAAFGLRGLVDLVFGTVTALPAALAALVGYGIGTSTGNVSFSTVIQSHVPDRLRGRVFSAFDLIWQAMRLASLLLGGLLADTAGIRAVYYTGGGLLVAAALAGLTLVGSAPTPVTGQDRAGTA